MLKIENNMLYATIPKGKTQEELIHEFDQEFPAIEKDLQGMEIEINGRRSMTEWALLGVILTHQCSSVIS